MPRPRIDAAGIGGFSPMGYGVAGSNPAVPTIFKSLTKNGLAVSPAALLGAAGTRRLDLDVRGCPRFLLLDTPLG